VSVPATILSTATTAILLAAGSGTRFGSQKLLARLPEGKRIVEASARRLLAQYERVVAVTGEDDEVRACLAEAGCDVVVNPHATEGMGTSLACGVAHARDSASWLIALADMPFVRQETLAGIQAAGQIDTHIVVPQFNQLRGHPVRFPAAVAEDLLALKGDRGARALFERRASRLLVWETDDSGVLADIDTLDDLARVANGRG
jgi:molybdenum cofactor cytidylyltransferase